MTVPATQLFGNERAIATKKDQLHVGTDAKTFAIFSLESRASQHRVFSRRELSLDQLTQILQPRPSIFVRQRNAGPHFLDVAR